MVGFNIKRAHHGISERCISQYVETRGRLARFTLPDATKTLLERVYHGISGISGVDDILNSSHTT